MTKYFISLWNKTFFELLLPKPNTDLSLDLVSWLRTLKALYPPQPPSFKMTIKSGVSFSQISISVRTNIVKQNKTLYIHFEWVMSGNDLSMRPPCPFMSNQWKIKAGRIHLTALPCDNIKRLKEGQHCQALAKSTEQRLSATQHKNKFAVAN